MGTKKGLQWVIRAGFQQREELNVEKVPKEHRKMIEQAITVANKLYFKQRGQRMWHVDIRMHLERQYVRQESEHRCTCMRMSS